ncbi:hypothetical protein ACG3SL_04010 [Sphingomonas sp. CJ20]
MYDLVPVGPISPLRQRLLDDMTLRVILATKTLQLRSALSPNGTRIHRQSHSVSPASGNPDR